MKVRIAWAGVLGGVALFAWGALSHMVLQLGDHGIENMPPAAEAAFVKAVDEGPLPTGLYRVPAMDMSDSSDAAMEAWAEKAEHGPVAMVNVRSGPGPSVSPAQYLVHLATTIAIALVASVLLACALPGCGSYARRTAFVAGLGVVTTLLHDVPFWNWYGFPGGFTLARAADSILGMAVTGLVVAAIVKPRSSVSASASGGVASPS